MNQSAIWTIVVIVIIIAIGGFLFFNNPTVDTTGGTFEAPDDAMIQDDIAPAMEEPTDPFSDEATLPTAPVATDLAPDPDAAMPTANIKTFNVTGQSFSFTPPEIRVNQGDTIRINFTSTDGLHDWVVDEFNAATEQVNTGESSSVEFVADQAGTFEYYCSVGQHRQMGMIGQLIVE